MKKISILLTTAFFIQVVLTGCSKKDQTQPDPTIPKAVYAAGVYSKNGKAYSTIWKDGVASVIDSNATVSDLFVTNPDVYVSGQKNNKGIFWKNGVSTQLVSDAAYGYVIASSIHVSGSDIHIVGFAENSTTFLKQAIYWKNNVPQMLNAGTGTENSYAQSVFVNGNDVYVAGYRTKISGGTSVVLWKNGIASDLISSTTASYDKVNLYISGSDVYVVCNEYDPPAVEQIRLWKNGSLVAIPASTLGAVPNCIAVNGTDVYIGGFEREGTPSNQYIVARYWKNNVAALSQQFTNGVNAVKSVYVDGTDIYACGTIGRAYAIQCPVVWKNGSEYTLTGIGNVPGEIVAVFVK